MNTQEQQHKIRYEKAGIPSRSIGANLIVTLILTLTAVLAIVFGARAVASIDEPGAGTLLQVPDDYATI